MTTRKRPMKLFIWEDVLADYTPGMACAIARTQEEAISLAHFGYVREELTATKPTEVIDISTASEPKLWHVFGGG